MIDPEKLAEELLSVQPMGNDSIKNIYDPSRTEKELKEDGYEPVSDLGLLWTKETKNSEESDT